MLVLFLVFFFSYDVTFKITNRLKVNINNFKFNGDFKSHITIERILEEHLVFPKVGMFGIKNGKC